ncbi:MAG: hypothetical protein C4K60_14605 [Ideonella sp. MAG2]|nr:MAG: hypothetical protein C4K60_14605 [Ideonella sp. MAG2]
MIKLLALLVLTYVLLAAAVWGFQRSLLYHPQSQGVAVPTVRVTTADGVEVYALVQAAHHSEAVLYFGGNAEDVSQVLPTLALAFPNRALYALQYRGFGQSQGRASEASLVADAQALTKHVLQAHSRLTVVGRSLGSGVAVQVAAGLARAPSLDRLVLVTPYDSMAEVAQGHYPWLPARWLIKDKFQSAHYAPQIRVPTLILVAEHDGVVPKERAQGLMRAFRPEIAHWVELPGTDHNSIGSHPRYIPLLGAHDGL